jgi:hypothetical protein
MRFNPDPQHSTLTDITEFLIDVEEGLLRGLGALGQAVHLILEALQQRRHRQPISARLFSHVRGLQPITKGENGNYF